VERVENGIPTNKERGMAGKRAEINILRGQKGREAQTAAERRPLGVGLRLVRSRGGEGDRRKVSNTKKDRCSQICNEWSAEKKTGIQKSYSGHRFTQGKK